MARHRRSRKHARRHDAPSDPPVRSARAADSVRHRVHRAGGVLVGEQPASPGEILPPGFARGLLGYNRPSVDRYVTTAEAALLDLNAELARLADVRELLRIRERLIAGLASLAGSGVDGLPSPEGLRDIRALGS